MKQTTPGSIMCFGEVLLRLGAPLGTRLSSASSLSVHVGGAEANCGAMLAQLGHEVEMITALPATPLGDLCEAELRRSGVGTRHVIRSDGRQGLYFFDNAAGAGQVFYDRTESAFSLAAGDFDWPALSNGARWFHVSGITIALGERAATAALEAAEAMRASGARISFDVNHRATLWDGRPPEDFGRLRDMLGMADVLFANPDDLSRILRIDEDFDLQSAFDRFANLNVLAFTRRSVEAGRQQLSACIRTRDTQHETDAAVIPTVVDRIGSGDAFAGGVIDALLHEEPVGECVRRGLAAAVMKHALAGDRWTGTRDDLVAFDPFVASSIRR